MAPKTHEINLSTTIFNQLTQNNYIIIKGNDINQNDYILFKQVEIINEESVGTGLFQMTQVTGIIQNEGLKEGYILIILNKL